VYPLSASDALKGLPPDGRLIVMGFFGHTNNSMQQVSDEQIPSLIQT
jgi:hypothetical protein